MIVTTASMNVIGWPDATAVLCAKWENIDVIVLDACDAAPLPLPLPPFFFTAMKFPQSQRVRVRCAAQRVARAGVPLNARNYLKAGSFCFTRPIPAHGHLRSRASRWAKFFTVNWSALFSAPSSDQSIGVDTAAPGRARVE